MTNNRNGTPLGPSTSTKGSPRLVEDAWVATSVCTERDEGRILPVSHKSSYRPRDPSSPKMCSHLHSPRPSSSDLPPLDVNGCRRSPLPIPSPTSVHLLQRLRQMRSSTEVPRRPEILDPSCFRLTLLRLQGPFVCPPYQMLYSRGGVV